MSPVRRDLTNSREIDVACVEHQLQQRERAHDLDTESRAQRAHVRVVGNDADFQNGRVAKNGDIDLRNSEGIRIRLISNKVDGGLDLPPLLPPDLQSDLSIVSILGLIDPRELAAQSSAACELPLELINEVETGPILSEFGKQQGVNASSQTQIRVGVEQQFALRRSHQLRVDSLRIEQGEVQNRLHVTGRSRMFAKVGGNRIEERTLEELPTHADVLRRFRRPLAE